MCVPFVRSPLDHVLYPFVKASVFILTLIYYLQANIMYIKDVDIF